MLPQNKFDLIIVGGGPAGTTAAKYAASQGIDVLVLEKDKEIGVPVRCGEAARDAGLKIFLEPQKSWIRSTIDHLRIISPSNHILDVQLKQKGYILDRRVFDSDLAQFAANEGALILTQSYVNGLIIEDDQVVGVKGEYENEPFEIKAKIVIGADGVESRVGRWAGINTMIKLKDMESAIQKTITGINVKDNRFDFYVSKQWAPGGYLWVFPKGKNSANVGLAVSGKYSKNKSAKKFLNEFIQQKFPKSSILNTTVGGVPCAKTLNKIITNGCMLAGDAAHMVNPMTGGGIVPGMRGGMLAGETAALSIKEKNYSEQFLKKYSDKWYNIGGKNHERFYSIKETISRLSDGDLDKIALTISKIPAEKRTIAKIFARLIFKKPSLLVDVMKVFAGV